ncbi:MAG: hypothetical protein D3918_03025 [Candidatus Electrothrix sp. AX2]|nr:hypothetical protein [Candidatus Electrothrix gigas]
MKIIATRMPQIKYDCNRKAENSSSVVIRGEFFGVSGGKIYALNRCVLVSLIIQKGPVYAQSDLLSLWPRCKKLMSLLKELTCSVAVSSCQYNTHLFHKEWGGYFCNYPEQS